MKNASLIGVLAADGESAAGRTGKSTARGGQCVTARRVEKLVPVKDRPRRSRH